MAPAPQPTGSVYLDVAPRPSRRPPVPRVDQRRVTTAGVIGVIGLIALSAAAVLVGVRGLLLHDEPFVAAFERSLDDPAARSELEQELATVIEQDLIGEELAEVAALYDLDVAAEADRLSVVLLDDPTVRAELAALVAAIHREVFTEPSGRGADTDAVSDAARAVIERESPRLAAIVPPGTALWTIEPGSLPDLTALRSAATRTSLLSLVAVVALVAAAAVHPRRHRVANWIGRWFLGSAVVAVVVAIGLPILVRELTGLGVAGSIVRASSIRLVAPGGIAALVGAGLVATAGVARHREKQRVLDEGAAAALGYDEPPLWSRPTSPSLELAQRGLVDAGDRLTNI